MFRLSNLIILIIFLILTACMSPTQQETIGRLDSAAKDTKIFVQLGHSQTVNSLAFSPDDQFVLSGSSDNTVKLWESKTGREIRTFQGHSKKINAVAFSPDGQFILSGSDDNTLKLWNPKTGRLIHTFKGHSYDIVPNRSGIQYGITNIAFSPDGKLALSGSEKNEKMILWNVKNGREIRAFEGRLKYITAVTFSPDGKFALAAVNDDMFGNRIKIFDINTGREIHKIRIAKANVVAFSPDSTQALSGGNDKILRLWDIRNGNVIRTFEGHLGAGRVSNFGIGDNIYSVAISPDGKLALSGSYINIINFAELKLWNVKTGQKIRQFIIPPFKVDTVAFSSDSKLALSSTLARIDMWNVKTGQKISSFQGHSLPANMVAFSPNGKLILSDSGDRTLRLREVKTGRQIRSFKGHSFPITVMAFSPDGKFILSGADGDERQGKLGELKLWQVNSGREIQNFQLNLMGINAVAFSPDSQLALLVGWNTNPFKYSLKLLDITNGREVHSFQGDFDRAITFTPDGKFILSGAGDLMDGGELNLWDIKSGRKVRTFQKHSNMINAVAVSPDGKLGLSGDFGNKLKLWNLKTGHEMKTFQRDSSLINSLVFSPNGKLALSGSNDHTLKLWDIKTGGNIRTFQGHFDTVNSVAFSPDGKLALSSSYDSTVRLWNVETGKEVAKMVNFIDGEWITITPEGYYMASLNGAKYLNVRVGNQVYGIDQYEAIYHRPDIVKLALEIGDSQKAIAQTIRQATQFAEVQPPKIWFIYPQNGYKTEHSSIEVQVNIQNIADTAEAISFTVNQRPVAIKGKRVLPTSNNVKTYTQKIPLQVGENQIQAIVRGNAGAVQRTPSLLVVRKGVKKKLPKLYYLGIGVAQHSQMPLKYPVKDVKGLETVLKQQQDKAYQRVITKTLTNQEATRSNIINAITTFFKPVKLGDIAILFISGHGMNTDLGYHFLTSDADPDKLESTGASWEIFNAINKLKAHVLLLADTCHAGNIVGNTDWQARAKVDPSEFLRQANLHNVIVLASSSGAGVSQEDSSWGHGAFTKALIEGLSGKATGYNKKVVKLSYLQDYVRERVPELTDNSQHPTIPRMTGSGEFLELVLAKK